MKKEFPKMTEISSFYSIWLKIESQCPLTTLSLGNSTYHFYCTFKACIIVPYSKLQQPKIVRAIIVKLKKHSDLPVYSLGHIAYNAANDMRYINCKLLGDRDCMLVLII